MSAIHREVKIPWRAHVQDGREPPDDFDSTIMLGEGEPSGAARSPDLGDRYHVHRLIGEGGMGEVSEAERYLLEVHERFSGPVAASYSDREWQDARASVDSALHGLYTASGKPGRTAAFQPRDP